MTSHDQDTIFIRGDGSLPIEPNSMTIKFNTCVADHFFTWYSADTDDTKKDVVQDIIDTVQDHAKWVVNILDSGERITVTDIRRVSSKTDCVTRH